MSALIAGIPSWVIPFIEILVSVVSLTVILERGWLLLRKIRPLIQGDRDTLIGYLRERRYADAASFCRLQYHPAFAVALRLIENRERREEFAMLVEEESLQQKTLMERYLPTLGSISTVAPLLGLLGTVTGMIKSFRVFEQSASRNAQLMGGIDEALITTALGLIIAIPSLLMYNYYAQRVNLLLEESDILSQIISQELK